MTEDLKKRKLDGDEELAPNKVLFILPHWKLELPLEETFYGIFECGEDAVTFDKICTIMHREMKRAQGHGEEGLIDCCSTWGPFIEFFQFCREKHCNIDDTEEKVELRRRQRARNLMMQVGGIRSLDDFQSDETGKDFIAEKIGKLKFTKRTDLVMDAGAFWMTIIVDPYAKKYRRPTLT